MLGLSVVKYKRELMQAFSDCFLPVKDSLGNVPVLMQKSKFITASILGVCRGYSESRVRDESDFDLIVDAVFEEIFRRESVEVQTRTESWLQSSDDEFMFFYFQAKYRTKDSADLKWLQKTVLDYFEPAHTVVFPL
ncbi:hypothetical protein SAMN04488079_101271 [Methylophaga sulfidovorans]|uniref:Uncharacterized protein n=2 Tax=Methylophaga sulfidovorans TaxID=45496 RepID=A0A1I3UAG9_9GAMM|nr:hypothetical protein SAMN04488079_101271 [Methylophaga sulfidovorans]